MVCGDLKLAVRRCAAKRRRLGLGRDAFSPRSRGELLLTNRVLSRPFPSDAEGNFPLVCSASVCLVPPRYALV